MTAIAIALLYASLFMFALSGLMVLSALRYRNEVFAFRRHMLEAVNESSKRTGRRL